MPVGIIIFGANGSGKSTLGRELARLLNITYMDIEDYHFLKSDIPYTAERSREDCISVMLADMRRHSSFVLSAVTGDFGGEIASLYTHGVNMKAPADIRIERVKKRANEKHGGRVLFGGDMYEQTQSFIDFVTTRPLDRIEGWAETLKFPVLHADGTRAVAENAARIVKWVYINKTEGLG